jgi:hypothetical protein
MSKFKFKLGQQVQIIVSQESGQVTGRAEYATMGYSYYLRYKSADGRAVEQWWEEAALAAHQPCRECGGAGVRRYPYSMEVGPCDECNPEAVRPSSTASATTEASVGSPARPGGSTK